MLNGCLSHSGDGVTILGHTSEADIDTCGPMALEALIKIEMDQTAGVSARASCNRRSLRGATPTPNAVDNTETDGEECRQR